MEKTTNSKTKTLKMENGASITVVGISEGLLRGSELRIDIVTRETFTTFDERIIDITGLRQWVKDQDRKTRMFGFPMSNVDGMMANHDWDDNMNERIHELMVRIALEQKVPSLLLLSPREDLGSGDTVDIIDGWHTFAILYRRAKEFNLPHVTFEGHFVTEADIAPFILPESCVHNRRVPPAGRR